MDKKDHAGFPWKESIQGLIGQLVHSDFCWFEHPGIGYWHSTKTDIYNEAYFQEYQRRALTEMSDKLMNFRIEVVNKYVGKCAHVLDIGSGAGEFILRRHLTLGYDINPESVKWLEKHEAFCDPYKTDFEKSDIKAVTFFDSFEHFENPERILSLLLEQKIVMSLPIFTGLNHVLASKHLKKDEHIWYFSEHGLSWLMNEHGYEIKDIFDMETQLGREDIMTFVFERNGIRTK